jgi:hypothetical protein
MIVLDSQWQWQYQCERFADIKAVFHNDEQNLSNRSSYNWRYNDLKCVCYVINDLEMTTGRKTRREDSVEIVPRGYLQISFLQPLRERQRSKGISRSKTLVVIVWVLEYFEINEMNFVFLFVFIGEWLVIRDYCSWVVLLAFGSFYGHSVCFLSFCHCVRNANTLFWSIIMVIDSCSW